MIKLFSLKNVLSFHKHLFYLLLFFLPLNLGKHFVFKWSYVNGLLVDYLIPTLYVQDILIILILFLYILDLLLLKKSSAKNVPLRNPIIVFLIFYVFCVFLSVLNSANFFASLYAFIRLILYIALSLYIYFNVNLFKELFAIVFLLSISLILISLLSYTQWFLQGAVFKNYLFFGEQPYSFSTPQIAIKDFFGFSKIPPYSLFSHPNVFGGFLSIVLAGLLLSFLSNRSKISLIAFMLGSIALFLTLSRTSWFSFGFSLAFIYLYNVFCTNRKKIILVAFAFCSAVAFFSVLLPMLVKNVSFLEDASLYRRIAFLRASFTMAKGQPLFGVGYNNNVFLIEKFMPISLGTRFAQPVHNIFVLILSESGILALLFFIGFYMSSFLTVVNRLWFQPSQPKGYLMMFLSISLQQFILLGSFDHYILTIHQTFLLFWIIIGFVLASSSPYHTNSDIDNSTLV